MDTPPKSPLDLALALADAGPARTHIRTAIITECAPHCLPGENVSEFALRTVAEEYRKALAEVEAIEEIYTDENAGGMARELAALDSESPTKQNG